MFKAGKYNIELGKKSYVMGILNVTPDSFSDGGKWAMPNLAIKRALEIQNLGADILDIGAQSTRPGYSKISPDEEIERLIPVLKGIKGRMEIPVSVDTFYPDVARKALNLGADIINDVTGFKDDKMFEVVSKSKCGIIIMHDMKGLNIKRFFEKQKRKAFKYNISEDRICFDPGIGFNKTYEENLHILGNVNKFKLEKNAILIGASRKRVVGMSCGNPAFIDRVSGSIAAHCTALLSGADIVRVHDIKESIQAIQVIDKIKEFKNDKSLYEGMKGGNNELPNNN